MKPETIAMIESAIHSTNRALADTESFPATDEHNRNALIAAGRLLHSVAASMVGLYEELKAAGIPIDSHEADLYCPDTPEARAILAKYPTHAKNARRFQNQLPPGVGEIWLDIPFAYRPFWAAKPH